MVWTCIRQARYMVGGSSVNAKLVGGSSVNNKSFGGSTSWVISKVFGGNSVICRYINYRRRFNTAARSH